MSLDCRLAFPPTELPKFLPASPFLFLFAPHYHPALAHIAPIRRQLNFRTIFNILGPLINPSRPGRMVLGVARKELGDTFAEVLKLMGLERALVVCGKEGLDEISPEGETWVCSSAEGLMGGKLMYRPGGSRMERSRLDLSTPLAISASPRTPYLRFEDRHPT
jgi:anthranilate phosphoribosyltransferase